MKTAIIAPYAFVIDRKRGNTVAFLGYFMIGCLWQQLTIPELVWLICGMAIAAFGETCYRYQRIIETADTMEMLHDTYRR